MQQCSHTHNHALLWCCRFFTWTCLCLPLAVGTQPMINAIHVSDQWYGVKMLEPPSFDSNTAPEDAVMPEARQVRERFFFRGQPLSLFPFTQHIA